MWGRVVLKDAFGALSALKASFSAANALKASFSTLLTPTKGHQHRSPSPNAPVGTRASAEAVSRMRHS
ncbi:hypothetical protein GCM10023192_85690 [Amycolatopsis samaneae]